MGTYRTGLLSAWTCVMSCSDHASNTSKKVQYASFKRSMYHYIIFILCLKLSLISKYLCKFTKNQNM